ncbi:MAG: hypothetical protein M1816_008252 [Peltula sp. TS41687]|nr:MAG: hypothetical protein M1816_008252 [Peltula sp. TS41687]
MSHDLDFLELAVAIVNDFVAIWMYGKFYWEVNTHLYDEEDWAELDKLHQLLPDTEGLDIDRDASVPHLDRTLRGMRQEELVEQLRTLGSDDPVINMSLGILRYTNFWCMIHGLLLTFPFRLGSFLPQQLTFCFITIISEDLLHV